MTWRKLHFILLLVFIASCKKEDRQIAELEHYCPPAQTYAKDISSIINQGIVTGIYEDYMGHLHVSVSNNGQLEVYQFEADGSFIKKVSLGIYYHGKQILVTDAYYISEHDIMNTPPSQTYTYHGWVETSAKANSSGDCTPLYTFQQIVLPKAERSSSTLLTKFDFDGNIQWMTTVSGDNSHVKNSLLFNTRGELFVLLKRSLSLKYKLRIDNQWYEVGDPAAPPFSADTIEIDRRYQPFSLYKINPSTGSVIRQKDDVFKEYMDLDATCALTDNYILASNAGNIYVFDLNANFIGEVNPFHKGCYISSYIRFMEKTDGQHVVVYGNIPGGLAIGSVKAPGTLIYKTNCANYLEDYIMPLTPNSFISPYNTFTLRYLGTDGGVYNTSGTSPAGANITGTPVGVKTLVGCSGNIIHAYTVLSGGLSRIYLIRKDQNGEL